MIYLADGGGCKETDTYRYKYSLTQCKKVTLTEQKTSIMKCIFLPESRSYMMEGTHPFSLAANCYQTTYPPVTLVLTLT
jgi:hypothetical protein